MPFKISALSESVYVLACTKMSAGKPAARGSEKEQFYEKTGQCAGPIGAGGIRGDRDAVLLPLRAEAAPYAGYVIDARNGQVLYARNAETRLHPASLTKMMTLYIVFEAVENGEIGLDDKVTISETPPASRPASLACGPDRRSRCAISSGPRR